LRGVASPPGVAATWPSSDASVGAIMRALRGRPCRSFPVVSTSITPPRLGSGGAITTQVAFSMNGSGGIARR